MQHFTDEFFVRIKVPQFIDGFVEVEGRENSFILIEELIAANIRHFAPEAEPEVAKMNRVADVDMVNKLYDASRARVQIDLIVRGVCTLRPGVPGLSENIRVRSIVSPLLEHSRVYSFENGGKPEVYIGSSDWMPRNLDRRVEVLAPVGDPALRAYLRDTYLQAYLMDNLLARELGSDGKYHRIPADKGSESFNAQLQFQEQSNVVDFEKR